MSKHTPGPWKHEVWDYPSATPPRKELEIVTDDALLATIAWDEGRDNPYTIKHDEAMANARLIATAPEMYTLLSEMLERWDNYEESGPDPMDDLMEKARKLLRETGDATVGNFLARNKETEVPETVKQALGAAVEAFEPEEVSKPKNTNCLEGMKCPNCGNEDRFYIWAMVECEVTDEGVENTGSADWNDYSKGQCPECKIILAVGDFRTR